MPLLSPLPVPTPPPTFVSEDNETPPATAGNSPEKMALPDRRLVTSPERMDSNDRIGMEGHDDGERKASWVKSFT